MPDSEELEKKEKREFMRETIVKPPLTRKQIAKRVALFVCASAAFGGVAAVSFAAVKPFADRCFQENGMQETSSVEFSKDDPDSVSPSDGADADMTAQPEQMEQEIDEAVSEALSSYQFSADNFNSMTSVLRGIGFAWMLNRPVRDGRLSTQGFMYFKVAKLVASVGVVGAFIALSDQPKHPFILLFLFWYLIYLIFETRFFWLYEKSRKGGKA